MSAVPPSWWQRGVGGVLGGVGHALGAVRTHTLDGQDLDPQVRAVLRLAPLGRPQLHRLGAPGARQVYRRSVQAFDPPPPPDVEVSPGPMVAGAAGPLASRLYRPAGAAGPLPALLFLHGGGFVIGDLDSHDAPCRQLAASSGCAVLAVAYRLAPEHPFPAAWEDAVAAWAWLVAHAEGLGLDPARLAVGGDSAGGNLAAGIALAARDLSLPPPALQLLIYPGTELRRATRSHRLFGDGYLLTGTTIDWFLAQYAPDADDPRASPLRADDLSGLAPAHVVLAGFDPLRDEGRAYARRLEQAGTPVTVDLRPGLVHAFLHLTAVVDEARAAVADMGRVLGTLRG